MTTETAPDPQIEAWSDRLEAELTEAGMEQAQARAYRRAFELGLTRVISQVATRKELQDGLAAVRQELQDGLALSRKELQDGLVLSRKELQDGLALSRRELQEGLAAVRQELHAAVAQLRQETKDAAADVKRELRFYMLLNIAFFGSLAGLIASRL